MTEPRPLTLDQKRAKYAWENVQKNRKLDGYANLTKSAPAFIMSNGLMQALAFYWSRTKNKEAAQAIVRGIIGWPQLKDFEPAMKSLYEMSSVEYMQATREALAMLRWLRQFADALIEKEYPR